MAHPTEQANMVANGSHEIDDRFASVVRRVHAQYPGVQVTSPVQACAYLGKFDQGVAVYDAIHDPTPVDDRWLGVCLYQQFDDARALEVLERAVARGEEAARINLAHVLRFLEQGDEAREALRGLRVDSLGAYDRVFYLRVLSMHEENNGSLREALRYAEEAWKKVQGLAEYELLAPSILAQLAILHSRIGRAQRSLWFFERGLRSTVGIENTKVRLRRVDVLSALGRHHEAEAELRSIENSGMPAGYEPELYLLYGNMLWSRGVLNAAKDRYLAAVDHSARLQITYEEFLSRLALTALESNDGDRDAAQQHLRRAQALISDKSDRLAYRFREVGLRLLLGEYTREHALAEYEALDAEFGQMGLLQEQGFVKLHAAGILLSVDRRRCEAVLDELRSLCVMLQNHAFLAKEWVLLPELRAAVRRTHPELLGEQRDILEVRTLGEEALLFAGEPVSIPLRRLVEVVAYFLEFKAVSLPQLLEDVFPYDKPRSAKSYFHQCRHQLKEHVPLIEIEFDREARLYRLKSQVDIVWDVAEVRAGRRAGTFGSFLPASGSDWALMLDHGLDRFRDQGRDAA